MATHFTAVCREVAFALGCGCVFRVLAKCNQGCVMSVSAVRKPGPLLVYGLCCALLAACAANDAVHDGQRYPAGTPSDSKTAGMNQRAVIGGLDNVVAGAVIAQYMDAQARELKSLAETLRVGDGIIVTLPEKVLFKIDSSHLEPRSRTLLRKIAVVVNKYAKTRLTVVGHTDDRGIADFDIRLSERRARAVADDLVKSDVSRQRISIIGMGFERPVAGNDTAEGRARNRRVEIHIAPNEKLREEDQSPLSR
jgi:outer membrane protein OmpA-like peptidoglycan-associated protein